MSNQSRAYALLRQLDVLIAKYEQTHPEVAKDLTEYRTAVLDQLQRGRNQEVAKTFLRLSVWIKFIMDNLPDG
jgi:hypothetical protein